MNTSSATPITDYILYSYYLHHHHRKFRNPHPQRCDRLLAETKILHGLEHFMSSASGTSRAILLLSPNVVSMGARWDFLVTDMAYARDAESCFFQVTLCRANGEPIFSRGL
jgi:hypothetical protein